MYLRLLKNLPVAPKHGARAGRVFKCLRLGPRGRDRKAWFLGDAGEKCAAFTRGECELYETQAAAEADEPTP